MQYGLLALVLGINLGRHLGTVTGGPLGKQYFLVKFPVEVVHPLEQLIQEHPEWGYRTVSEAAKYALVHFTEYLQHRAAGGDAAGTDSLVQEMAALLQRHARRDTASPKKKA